MKLLFTGNFVAVVIALGLLIILAVCGSRLAERWIVEREATLSVPPAQRSEVMDAVELNRSRKVMGHPHPQH